MATYSDAPADAYALMNKAIDAYHPELKEAGVTVTVLFARAARDEDTGEPKGPALKHNGYPAAATIRVTNQQNRVAGQNDAVMVIDGDRWNDWSEERQLALIDHELTHLEVVRDEDNAIKLDDCCRPKLKLRPHDAQVGVFYRVMARHGVEALDTKVVAELYQDTKEWVQPMLELG